ncbi:MAG TPA: hypothetical protein VK925_12480 [Jiangellaceae bacterium]|nr:hypothetical protein [Jiangellaceae bacterium]
MRTSGVVVARWIVAATLALTGVPLAVAVLFAAHVAASCGDEGSCQPGQVAMEGDLGRPSGSTGPITNAELAAIGRTVGRAVPAYSILRDPAAVASGWGGPSVNLLAPAMKPNPPLTGPVPSGMTVPIGQA